MDNSEFHEFKYIESEETKAFLIELRKSVSPILAKELLPHFTDHSVSHSDRVIKIIIDLIEPLQEKQNKLTQVELKLLYAACYLHDFGMHYENISDTKTFQDLELKQKWVDLTEDTKRNILREHHHKLSSELTRNSVNAQYPPIGYQLKDDRESMQIAALCESHGLDVEDERYQELIRCSPSNRIDFLTALLRVADILDESRIRASRDVSRSLNLTLEEQTHWWRHYYTDEILIDNNARLVTICFTFPDAKKDEYSKIIPQLQIPWIKKEFENHKRSFYKHELAWDIDFKILDNPYESRLEAIPEKVILKMLKQLDTKKRREANSIKKVIIESFSEAQPVLMKRFNSIVESKDMLETEEYINDLYEVSKDLWDLGSKRSAWIFFSSEFKQVSSSIKAEKQFEMGIWLIKMMVEDDSSKSAIDVLQKIEVVLENFPINDEQIIEFYKLKSLVMFENYKISAAIDALTKAMSFLKNGPEVDEIKAQLSEIYLLTGYLDRISMD